MIKRFSIFFLFIAIVALAVVAYWLLFTTFMSYDDEGYVLVSLKNYSNYGGLYSKVYSQYGPFFYFFQDLGHRFVNYEFSNTSGRLTTLLCWIFTSVTCAHLVWRQTKAASLTVFTLGFTFFHLYLMINEPVHPGGLIAAIVALGAWWGARQIENGKMRLLAISAGLVGTSLVLTKINVGIFFLTAAWTWFAIQLRDIRQARWATIVAAAILVLLPFALMRAKINEPWALLFAVLSAIGSLGMLTAAKEERQPLTGWSDVAWGTVFLLVSSMIVIWAVCLRGTSLIEMLQGVLLDPMRQPDVFSYPPDWQPGAIIGGGISLLLATLVWSGMKTRLRWILAGLRLFLVIGFCLTCLERLPFTSQNLTMSYLVPMAWIFVPCLSHDDKAARKVTAWCGVLLVLQYLHAYPVAVSQVAWGTFLVVPVMALGLNDTFNFLAQQKLIVVSVTARLTFSALAFIAASQLGVLGWHRYESNQPLALSGAQDIRLPNEYASSLRVLCLNAIVHGDMLYSLPGMFSFNSWTDLQTPTLANSTSWFSLLSARQQTEIVKALNSSKRPVVIVHKLLLDSLKERNFRFSGPLYDYLAKDFACAFTIGIYEFHVRRDRRVTPFSAAELLQLQSPQPGMASHRLELIVAVPLGRQVASVELVTLEDTPRELMRWDKMTGPLLSTAISPQGILLESERDSAWNRPLPSFVRLGIPLQTPPPAFLRGFTAVYLRDSDGSITAEARFME